MGVETYLDPARERVRAERERAEAKRGAYGAFLDRLADVSASAGAPSLGAKTVVGDRQRSPGGKGCRAVRTAFSETVRPHCAGADGESVEQTLRSELSESVAVALSATSGAALTPAVKRAVATEARRRRRETAVLGRALEREATQLREAAESVGEITAWIAEADERPLPELGFDELARRHDRLGEFRERCSTLARERQSFLRATTSLDGETGLRHRCLVGDCYRDFPVDHPVLATAAGLAETCEECRRAVRAHLVRRA